MTGRYHLTDPVLTTYGPVQGHARGGMRQWLGIPYASPPIESLRWRPPVPPTPWHEPFMATNFGSICAQEEGAFPGFGSNSSTEDCLYLNVYAPEKASSENLPVMVWLHGGGLFQGASNHYNPKWLVREGNILFISLNYRLNLFGFFSHPIINAEDHACGNYGIMDQQEALRWVRLNIEAFGGNPNNVTIFGQSAGAISVSAHLSSPFSRNLFQKAIIQSGGSPITFAHPALEDLAETGVALIKAAGCHGNRAEDMRRVPAEMLLKANSVPRGTFGTTKFPFGLMEDGCIIPTKLPQAFRNGNFARVPVMIGVTTDEFAWFQGMIELSTKATITEASYPESLRSFLEKAVDLGFLGVTPSSRAFDEVLRRYPSSEYPHPARAVAAAVGDAGIVSTAGRRAARVIREYVTEVFVYEFAVDTSPVSWPPVSFPYGACHAQELQFLFEHFHGASGEINALSETGKKLAHTMVRYWTAFAHNGVPSQNSYSESGDPTWDIYEPSSDNAMLLQAPKPRMISGWGLRHHMDFWDSFY